MENLKEFKELILRYESLTLEEVEEAFNITLEDMLRAIETNRPCTPKQVLTGFGSAETCTLCKAINAECERCVYYSKLQGARELRYGSDCHRGVNKHTYGRLLKASTPQEFLKACRERAKHMRKLLSGEETIF